MAENAQPIVMATDAGGHQCNDKCEWLHVQGEEEDGWTVQAIVPASETDTIVMIKLVKSV